MPRIALMFIVLMSGCASITADAWNLDNSSCPDDDYDNGGRVELMPGYCKSGTGAMVSYIRKF